MVITPDPACQELVELVTEYLEGTLADDVAAAFDRHLAECPYCAEFLDQIRHTIRLTGSVHGDDLSVTALDALMDGFRDWHRRRGTLGHSR